MKTRGRQSATDSGLNLDPLADMLANSVGLMLFVLIFAVLGAQSTTFSYFMPLEREPDKEMGRLLVLCSGNTVRPYCWTKLYRQLTAGVLPKKLTFNNMSALVSKFNGRRVQDEWFSMRGEAAMDKDAQYLGWSTYYQRKITKLDVVVEPIPGAIGDYPEDLDGNDSKFAQYLSGLNAEQKWLLFLVDTDSLEVYHAARKLAEDKGFDCGWFPHGARFPDRNSLLSSSASDVGVQPPGPD